MDKIKRTKPFQNTVKPSTHILHTKIDCQKYNFLFKSSVQYNLYNFDLDSIFHKLWSIHALYDETIKFSVRIALFGQNSKFLF